MRKNKHVAAVSFFPVLNPVFSLFKLLHGECG